MADVFISYSHVDREIARAIAGLLTTAGASVWWDRELIAGQDFDDIILRELTAASCVVVIWTQDSILSRYVRGEANVAADKRKLLTVALEGVDPPLGFRVFHLLRVGTAGVVDNEFANSLRRAVEERIDRTLKPQESSDESNKPKSSPDISAEKHRILAVDDAYTTLGIAVDCVWLGNHERIEVFDSSTGRLLGERQTAADALFALPVSNDVVCFGWGIGYQAPDTIRVTRWKLRGSLEDVRRRNLEAEDYIPGPWESSRDTVIKSVHYKSIVETNLFVTWAWQPGPVDLSDDGHQIAVFVDLPAKRVQIRRLDSPDESEVYVPLGNCYPDMVLLLQGSRELVTIEHRKADGASCVSLWNVGTGQLVAKHDFDYLTVNCFCRTGVPGLIALGLDQSIAFINVNDGTIEAQIQMDSRPVQACAFDSQSNRVGLLTNEELALIDLATMRTWKTLKHFGSKGIKCGLCGLAMAALVTTQDDRTQLILWDLTEKQSQSVAVNAG